MDIVSSLELSREFILQVANAIPISWARCSKVIAALFLLCSALAGACKYSIWGKRRKFKRGSKYD